MRDSLDSFASSMQQQQCSGGGSSAHIAAGPAMHAAAGEQQQHVLTPPYCSIDPKPGCLLPASAAAHVSRGAKVLPGAQQRGAGSHAGCADALCRSMPHSATALHTLGMAELLSRGQQQPLVPGWGSGGRLQHEQGLSRTHSRSGSNGGGRNQAAAAFHRSGSGAATCLTMM